MDKLENHLGYLLLKDDGAVLKSGGELENDERCANIIMELLHLADTVDESFMANSSCERISIVYEDHCYNICMSDRRIYVVKQLLRGPGVGSTSNGNGNSNGFIDDESVDTSPSTIIA